MTSLTRHAVAFTLALCATTLYACAGSDRSPRADTVSMPVAARAVPARASGDGDTTTGTPSSTGLEYYSAATLSHVADSLSHGSSTGHRLGDHGTYQYLMIRRPRSGGPEVHDRWTDVTVVQAGRGTLLSGGHVSGDHVESPGEHRGGTIQGGTSRPVGAGDLMIIPAGMPHQYLIAAGDSLRYITLKVLQPTVPR